MSILTPDQMAGLFEEHRRETDQKFQKVLEAVESVAKSSRQDYEHLSAAIRETSSSQIRTDASVASIANSLQLLADTQKEHGHIINKPPEKAPYFQIIATMVSVMTMLGLMIVGYVNLTDSHNAALSLEMAKTSAARTKGAAALEEERETNRKEREAALYKWIEVSFREHNTDIKTNDAKIAALETRLAASDVRFETDKMRIDGVVEWMKGASEETAKLREKAAAGVVVDEAIGNVVIGHTSRQGSAGHPVPTTEVTSDKGLDVINRTPP